MSLLSPNLIATLKGLTQNWFGLAGRGLLFAPSETRQVEATARELASRGEFDEALKLLNQALTLVPDVSLTAAKADVLRQLGRHAEALEMLDRRLLLMPDPALVSAKLQILLDQGELDAAIELLQQVVRNAPDQTWAEADLGAVLHNLGRYAEAASVLGDVLPKMAPDASGRSTVLGILGSALGELERGEEALRALNEAVRLSPEEPWLLNTRAQILTDFGVYEPALAMLNQALARDPRNPGCQATRGWVFKNLGRQHAAEMRDAYAAACDLEPSNLWAVQGLADALQLLNQPEAAAVQHRRVIHEARQRIHEISAETFALMGWSHYRLDEFEEAMRCLEKALYLKSDRFYAQFDLALVATCSQQFSLAEQKYTQVIQATYARDLLRGRGMLFVARRGLKDALVERPELDRSPAAQHMWALLDQGYRTVDRQVAPTLASLGFDVGQAEAAPAPAYGENAALV